MSRAGALPYTGYIEPTAAGESIRWGDWRDTKQGDYTFPITLFPYASGGDYSGDLVELSNYRVLSEDPHVMRRSVTIRGGHGTYGIAYIGAPTRLIQELCNRLSGYPLLDESHHSELEMEIEQKEWADWGRRDFARKIEKAYGLEDIDDRILDLTWYAFAADHGDMGRMFEQGESCHFFIDHAMKWLKAHREFGSWLVMGPSKWCDRDLWSVARDAAQEERFDVCRTLLDQIPDITILSLGQESQEGDSED